MSFGLKLGLGLGRGGSGPSFPFGNIPEDLSGYQIMSANGMTFPANTFTANTTNVKNIVQYRKRRNIPEGMDGENVRLGFSNTLVDTTGQVTTHSYPETRQATIHYDGVVYDAEFGGSPDGSVTAGKLTFSDAVTGLSLDHGTAPNYYEVGKVTSDTVTDRYTAQTVYYRFGEFHHQSQASDNIDFLDGTEIPVGTEALSPTVVANEITAVTVDDGGANWSGAVTIWAWEEQSDGHVRDVQIGTATLTGDAISSVAITMNETGWTSPTLYAVPPLVGADQTGFLSHRQVPAATIILGETSGTRNNADIIGDSLFLGIEGNADINGNSGVWERGLNNRAGSFSMGISGVRLFDFVGLTNYPLYKELTDRGLFDKTLIQAWTNDLAHSKTPADIMASMVLVRDYKQNAGSLVQIATGTPRTSSSDTWATVANQSILAGANGPKFWYENPAFDLDGGGAVNTSMEMEAISSTTAIYNDDTNDTFRAFTLGTTTNLEFTLTDDLPVVNSGYYCGMSKAGTNQFDHMDSNGSTGRVLKKYELSGGTTLQVVSGYETGLAFTGANVVAMTRLSSTHLVVYTDNDDKVQLVSDNGSGTYTKVGSGYTGPSGFQTCKVAKVNATTVAICGEGSDRIDILSVDTVTGVFTKIGELALSSFLPILLSGFVIFDMKYRSDNNIAFVDPKNRQVHFLVWDAGTSTLTPSANLLTVGGTNTINICFPTSTRMFVAVQSTATIQSYDYVNEQLVTTGGDMLEVNAALRAETITQDYKSLDMSQVFHAADAEHLYRADRTLVIDSSTNMTADGVHYRTGLGQLWGSTQAAPFFFNNANYFEFEYLGTYSSTADLAEYTFSAVDLGLADTRRVIKLTIQGRKGSPVTTINSVTIGGVAAVIANQTWNDTSSSNVAAIVTAEVPAGATGDIVITFAAAMLRCAIGVYRGINLSTTAFDDAGSTANDPTATLDIPSGGVGLGCADTAGAGSTTTWTGLTEDYDATIESVMYVTSANDKFYAAETGRAILVNFTAPANSAGAFASFEAV